MGYRNGTLIWNGLMLTNSSFFKCCTSIFNIMCCSWAFHSAYFYLIRARKKIYLVICIHCEKFIFSWMKIKMVLKTHFLSLNIQSKTRQVWRCSEKYKSETVISVAYGTEFVSMAATVFYLACLFVLCLHLLACFTY